jgi:hypothetical protein
MRIARLEGSTIAIQGCGNHDASVCVRVRVTSQRQVTTAKAVGQSYPGC